MRLILYTGKGGVGKTSLAAAMAIKLASQGKRTLLVGSDMANNLSDVFARRRGLTAYVLSHVSVMSFRKDVEKKQVSLTVNLPDIDKSKLDIARKDHELIIDTGVQAIVLSLSDTLSNCEIESAKYEGKKRVILFSEPSDVEKGINILPVSIPVLLAYR